MVCDNAAAAIHVSQPVRSILLDPFPVIQKVSLSMSRDAQARRELSQFLRHAFASDPNVNQVDALLEFVCGGDPPAWQTFTVSDEDAMFVKHLSVLDTETVTRSDHRYVRDRLRIRTIGHEHDAIARLHRTPESLLRAVNAIASLTIMPTRATAIVVTVRNEGIALLEWLAHYRVLGFDAIFVYCNDNDDGSDDLLQLLAEHGVISLIRNDLDASTPPQQKVYGHAVHLLRELRDFEWVFFIDADEFLLLAPRFEHSIANYIRDAEAAAGSSLSAICVHWRWYGSGKAFERTEGLLMERFQEPHNNRHVKTLCRLRDTISLHQVHVPTLVSGRLAVTSSFVPCVPEPELPVDYGGAQLNHYWNKSFQEFVLRLMRGDGRLRADAREKDLARFFVWGQAPRPSEPVAAAVLTKVRDEMGRLQQLRGVAGALDRIEERFNEMVADCDRQLGLRQLYETHMNPDL